MHSRNKFAALGTGLVLGGLLITGCWGQPDMANVDHAKVMEEARTKFLNEMSADMQKQLSGETAITLKGVLNSPMATANLDLASTVMTILSDTTEGMGLTAKLMLSGNVAGFGSGEVNLDLELRQIAKMLYLKLSSITATSDSTDLSPMLNAYLPAIKAYEGRWYSMDTATGTDGDTPTAQESIQLMKDMLETAKQYEIFERVEVLPMEGGMYVYKVKPNSTEIVKLIKAIALKGGATEADFTPEAEKELTDIFNAMGNEQVTHKLYIDSKDNTYKKLVSTGAFDVENVKMDLSSELGSKESGKSEFNVSLKATPAGTTDTSTITMTGMSSFSAGNMTLKAEVPGQETTFDLTVSSTFKEGTPAIDTPAAAEDLAALLAGLGLTTSTDSAAITDDAAMMLDGEDPSTMNEMPTGTLEAPAVQ